MSPVPGRRGADRRRRPASGATAAAGTPTPAGPRRAPRPPAGAPDVQVGAPRAETCACGSVSGTAAPAADGQDDDPGLADDVGDADRAVHAGVRRVVAVVAHDPQLPLGHLHGREVGLGAAEVRLVVDVRLVERLPVDGDAVLRVAAGHGLPAGGDDALDEVLLVRRGQPDQREPALQPPDEDVLGALATAASGLAVVAPGRRPAEHDDVAGRRLGEAVGDLVDGDAVVVAAVAAVQRAFHRRRRDDVDAGQERLDDERQHHRDDDQQRQLAPERALALGLLALALACRRCPPRGDRGRCPRRRRRPRARRRRDRGPCPRGGADRGWRRRRG